jgi:hypothetical protein
MTRFLRQAAARLPLLAVATVLAAIFAGVAGAAPGVETRLLGSGTAQLADPVLEELALVSLASSSDPSVTHIGPIHSTSGDSGTCGPDWAEDTFDRYYTIRPTSDPRVFEVYEQYKNGSFVTYEGFSPGACEETDGSPPGHLDAGVLGTMHGYILTLVTCDLTLPECPDPDATCSAGACDTTNGFIEEFFGPGALRNDEAWFFHYAGYDGYNTTLVAHEWKNASCNRGGNHGDIATEALLLPPPFTSGLCL